ncbi:MAG: hypothetical protein LBF50_03845 [Azoarcus sp.]|jgi:hypothetical protein|nr:hypothetical protein [Azoarcus sp.]
MKQIETDNRMDGSTRRASAFRSLRSRKMPVFVVNCRPDAMSAHQGHHHV